MAKIRKDFCPICGKVELSREPVGEMNWDAGGWNERVSSLQLVALGVGRSNEIN